MNGFGVRSWPHFYHEAFLCLKPGGWVENQEFNCQILEYKMPIGPWPKNPMLKEAGKFGLLALHTGVYGMSVKLFRDVLGWSEDQLQVFLAAFRKELMKKSIHSYWPTCVDALVL